MNKSERDSCEVRSIFLSFRYKIKKLLARKGKLLFWTKSFYPMKNAAKLQHLIREFSGWHWYRWWNVVSSLWSQVYTKVKNGDTQTIRLWLHFLRCRGNFINFITEMRLYNLYQYYADLVNSLHGRIRKKEDEGCLFEFCLTRIMLQCMIHLQYLYLTSDFHLFPKLN